MRAAKSLRDSIPAATLGDRIFEHARRQPKAPALIASDGAALSYADLAAEVRAIGETLIEFGIPPGSTIGVVIPHSIEAAIGSIAAAVHGVHVPLNPNATAAEHDTVIARLRPRAILTDDRSADRALAAAKPRGLDVLCIGLRRGGVRSIRRIREGRATPLALPEDVLLILCSSGTTGAPKFIPMTHHGLIAMTDTLARAVDLSASDRSACTAPLYLGMGLTQTLFGPLLLGGSVAVPAAAERNRPDLWSARLCPTWLTSTPASLRALVDSIGTPGAGAISATVRFILCGSSLVPERLRTEGGAALGLPILAAYGLSEAGLISAMPPPPAHPRPGTVGVPAPGELIILGQDGEPAPAGSEGEIALSGPSVMPGYLSEDGAIEPRPQWFPTGDIGRLDADGALTITGRSKEMINRGGEKISPYEIEAALLAHPDVLDAAAFPIPHPRLGEVASAAVVLRPGTVLPEDGYRAFLARSLSRAKLPDPVVQLEALPRSAAGKVLRRELAQRGRETVAPIPPDSLLEMQIQTIWARTLKRNDVGVEEDFFAAGGDSLMSANMTVEIETVIGRPVPPLASDRPMTVREIARLIMEEKVEHGSIQEPREKTGAPPFFFCHGDYLNHGFYARQLADLTAGERQMYLVAPPIQATARNRAPYPVLARDYVLRLLELQPEGPFVLGGYCNGGIFAWELARQLIASGREVQALILVDTLTLNLRPEMRLAQTIACVTSLAAAPFGRRRALQGSLMLLAWKAFRGELADSLRRRLRYRTGLSAERPHGMPAFLLHAFYSMGVYRPPPLPVPVYCITCESSEQRADFDPQRWAKVAGSVKRWTIPGEHWTCITVHVDRLAAAMTEAFRDIRSGAYAPEPAKVESGVFGPVEQLAPGN